MDSLGSQYDLAVAYRIYPKVSKTPLYFGDDKLRLAELCLRSFRRSLGSARAKVWVILDACPPEYIEIFTKCFEERDLVFVPLDGKGNLATFDLQLKLLSEQQDSEAVYFAEDDYYYLPGQFSSLLRFLETQPDADFVTPYDHIDYYTLDLHRHVSETRTFEGRRWRRVSTTCLTFLTRRKVLTQTIPILRTYCKGNWDSSVWLNITKMNIFSPVRWFRYLLDDRLLFSIIARAWWHHPIKNLVGKRWKLWVPTPGVATHMERTGIAPGIDWDEAIQSEMSHISGIPIDKIKSV